MNLRLGLHYDLLHRECHSAYHVVSPCHIDSLILYVQLRTTASILPLHTTLSLLFLSSLEADKLAFDNNVGR